MKSELPIEALRFKTLREELNLTQQAFAIALSINNSTADIERGKTKISGAVVAELMEQFRINPLWLFGKSNRKLIDLTINTTPKVVTVNSEDRDNIVMVNVKAAAGYPHNIQDVDWYEELPAFSLPLPEFRNATYRGFQIEGDSMLPALEPGEWVLAKAVESLDMLSNHTLAVVVMNDSVLVKKVSKHQNNEKLSLISLNADYPPITITTDIIQELWEVKSKISGNIDTDPGNQNLSDIRQSIKEIQKEIASLKK
ncbi:XRE family transcriptional regulator [Robertkochia solimangrovi]|uniref:XRE family transcriptional regulator n=1 Tax=Robertkochia solimangrovi TaxID=2213046 RepID=UPI00117FF23D|nr:LexA family transcriptional regulator [Robertkochia solimangrovi]TRZ43216.1 DNA-binding protein [Robertkochia solimangrovi]